MLQRPVTCWLITATCAAASIALDGPVFRDLLDFGLDRLRSWGGFAVANFT